MTDKERELILSMGSSNPSGETFFGELMKGTMQKPSLQKAVEDVIKSCNCPNCAAPVKPNTSRCAYCGPFLILPTNYRKSEGPFMGTGFYPTQYMSGFVNF